MSTEETYEVVQRHADAMRISHEAIIADYADDAIVISNLIDRPLVGRDAIYQFIQEVVTSFKPADAPHTPVVLKEAEGDYLLQVLEDENGFNVETFVVKGGKIVFESTYQRAK